MDSAFVSSPWIIPANGMNHAMQAFVHLAEIQVGGLMKQCLQVKGRVFTDPLHLDEIRLIEGLTAFKGKHLKVVI
jgi:hypothetical protein